LLITELDNGRTLGMSMGAPGFLRLSGGPLWDEPTVEGTAVELVRVYYEEDPGYEEWAVYALRPGAATISTTARQNPPDPAAQPLLHVEITIEVGD
jgi:hypothetical protein